MKVVLLAVGSRGDVAPMVALGRELSGRGVPVTVVTLADYVPLVTAAGLHPATVAVSMAESVAAVPGGTAAVSRSVLAYTRGVSRWLAGIAPAVADTVLATVEPGDLIVAGLLSFDDAAALAEARGCRVLNALFAPLLPTAHGPSTLAAVRPQSITRLNAWAGSIALTVTAGMATTTGRHLRERLGLRHTSARGFVDLVLRTPALAAMSPLVVPPAPDWPETALPTGFWVEPEPVGEPDEQLRDFVAAGPPPVCVGFGSIGDTDVELVTAAARQAGQRVVVVAPEGLADPAAGSGLDTADALVVRSAPFRWLFPRSAAVIHHGGAGTTAESLLAGRPTAVVATGADQPYFGRRMAELGAGPPPLRRRDLTVDRLATLMAALTGPDSSFRSYAGEIAAERGAAIAADHLVAHLRRTNPLE